MTSKWNITGKPVDDTMFSMSDCGVPLFPENGGDAHLEEGGGGGGCLGQFGED